MTEDTPHGRLVGMDDATLLGLAPETTHQHRKGGLYRDLGIAVDADTRGTMTDAKGRPLRGWLHVHPHARQLMMRATDEDDRFRPLSRS